MALETSQISLKGCPQPKLPKAYSLPSHFFTTLITLYKISHTLWNWDMCPNTLGPNITCPFENYLILKVGKLEKKNFSCPTYIKIYVYTHTHTQCVSNIYTHTHILIYVCCPIVFSKKIELFFSSKAMSFSPSFESSCTSPTSLSW